jgi:hypothetical protein
MEVTVERVRRSSAAAVIVSLILLGSTPATSEAAAKKKGDPDGQTATCDYLRSVIEYPYTSPIIKAWAISLYRSQGCQPALP